jgi:AsmA protein
LDQLATIDVNSKQNFGDIEAFSFGITLTELLKGQVNADELTISGLTLRLNKDKKGKANWEAIGAKNPGTNTADDQALNTESEYAEKSSLFSLNALVMDHVQLNNIYVSYIDQQNDSEQNITIESFSGKQVNLQGNAFPIKTQLTASANGNQTSTIVLELSSDIALSGFLAAQDNLSNSDNNKNSSQQIAVSDIDASINISQQTNASQQVPIDTQAISIEGNASYRLNDNAFVLDNMIIASDHSKLALTLNGIPISSNSKSPSSDLEITGKLDLKIANIQKQLNALGQSAIATSDSEALKTLSLNADIAGQITDKKQTFSLAKVNASLDDSKIDGALSILLRDKQKPLLSSKLNIDAINLDRYLAETVESAEASNTANNSAAANNSENIDLSFLDTANILATLSINQLTLNQLDFSNLNAEIDINSGDVKQANFKGQFYSSDISADVTLNRSKRSEPLLSVKQSVKGLDVAALIEASLKDSDKSKVLSGTADTESNLTMKGNSTEEWLRSLSGSTEIKLSDGIYHSDNIEHRICQAVALARNERLKTNWPRETALQNVNATINWQNGLGKLATFKGGLSNVILDGEGTINLINSRYSLALDAIITGTAPEQENTRPTDSATPSSEPTSQQTSQPSDQAAEQTPQLNNSDPACVINERYRDIAWPILCEGSLADTEGEQSGCAVNRNKVNALIKTAVKEKAREKDKTAIEKKIDKELGDKLDEGIKDLIKGGLEGLFK